MESKNVVIVVVLVLLAVVSYPVWVPKLMLAVGSQAYITIRLVPEKANYEAGEMVIATGTLTCSGMCPLAAMPYPGMDVDLTSSWGWSKTVLTDDTGRYSSTLALPTQVGQCWVKATFHGGSAVVTATVNATVVPEFHIAPLVLLITLSCLLFITKRYGIRKEKN